MKPRNTYRELPNIRVAQTRADLQTIQTNAAKHGMSSGDFVQDGNKTRDVFWIGKPPPPIANIVPGATQDAGDNTTPSE